MSNAETPLVSVIIPAYNAEANIAQCLDSVLAQTLSNIEIICIDDGSSDGTFEILKQYQQKDPRVLALTQKNSGAGRARNLGLEKANGKYLSFLDADDFFEPDMLEKAYTKAEETQAEVVVFRSNQYYGETDEFKEVHWTLRSEHTPPWEPFSYRAITTNAFKVFVGWAWDKLFLTSFVRENNLTFQEQRTTNDMLFVFSAIVAAKRIAILEDVLAHQRRAEATSLSNTREQSWDCFYNALSALRNFLKERDLFWDLEPDFVDYALHACMWNLETLNGSKKEVLYNKLKDEWFADLGITSAPDYWFTNNSERKKYLQIMDSSFNEYMNAS